MSIRYYSLEVRLGIDAFAKAEISQFYDKRSQQLELETAQNPKAIKLFNINGQLLLEKELQGQRESVDMARFPNGIYIAIVETEMV